MLQLFHRQRFFKVGVVPSAPRARVGDGIAERRERDQARLTARGMGADLARELVAVHYRHAEIAENEIRAALRDEALDSFLAIRGDGDVGAEGGQHVTSEFTVVPIIFDDQHGDTTKRHRRTSLAGRGFGVPWRGP